MPELAFKKERWKERKNHEREEGKVKKGRGVK
jgi:hypothetical protein